MKKSHHITISVLILYVLLSLPLVLLFYQNKYFRVQFFNYAAHYAAKISTLETVHIGDSLTAGAGGVSWSIRLFGVPLKSRNLATNGYTVRQVKHLTENALSYKPNYIIIMAGTNDLFDPRFDKEFSLDNYESLINKITHSPTKCIITLIPYQSSLDHIDKIYDFNNGIIEIANQYGATVINLNTEIAPNKVLLPKFTSDGVHLSNAAYDLWASKIRLVINSSK